MQNFLTVGMTTLMFTPSPCPLPKEGVSKMSLRGAKRRSNPRKSVENKEIATLPTLAGFETDSKGERDTEKAASC
jgi:hypothetical protein